MPYSHMPCASLFVLCIGLVGGGGCIRGGVGMCVGGCVCLCGCVYLYISVYIYICIRVNIYRSINIHELFICVTCLMHMCAHMHLLLSIESIQINMN